MPRSRDLPACRAGAVPAVHAPHPAFELNGPAGAPVVVVLGGISAHRHVTANTHDASPGWWQGVVGRGGAIDPHRERVLSMDWAVAGSGPTTTEAQAAGLAAILDHLGIATVKAIVGASYGGMVALAFAAAWPSRLERLILLSAAHRPHPMATGLRVLQRRILQLGLLAGTPTTGVALARALGMTTYRSEGEFAVRFGTAPSWKDGVPHWEVEAYLDRQGRTFAERFEARRYLALSESLDLHAVDPASIRTPTTLFAVEEDRVVPSWQVRELRDALAGPTHLVEVSSRYGHDAFLTESEIVTHVVRSALAEEGIDVAV